MQASVVVAAGIFFLLTGAQCEPINGKEEQCDRAQMNKCFLSFLGELGIKDFPRSAGEVFTVIFKIIDKEEFNGVKRVCTAARNLRDCAGSQYDFCVSEEELKKMGVPEQDAELYALGSLILKQVCVDAWDGVTQENYDCTRNTYVSNKDYLNQCTITYVDNIKKDPAHTCKYAQELIECFDQPFEDSCDPIVA